MSPQPLESFKGFGVTFKQIFKKPITQQYPEYKRPVYPRFRGRHRLWRHENGLEKCVGCSLCAAACPADCIRVVPAENTAGNRVSAGERYARIYEINMSRCIFCGYCELACPFFSALALIGNLGSLAVLFLLASAEFVAAAQVLVYAGAVMVMFLFVIAYLGGRADAPWAGGPSWLQTGAVVAATALLVEIVVVIGLAAGDHLDHEAKITSSFGSPAQIGRLFLTDHLLAFEITSIVLLVAAVGGVVLGSHSRRLTGEPASVEGPGLEAPEREQVRA